MSAEHLCLKWNNFENNIASYLDVLRSENDFVDVTITCGEKNFKAHKVILSACSPYFRGIFQENPCSHPVIILKNVNSNEMEAIIQYIYTGETYIAKDDLFSFLNTANLLQIIGLVNYNLQESDQPVWKNGTFFASKATAEFVRQERNQIGNPPSKSPNVLVKKLTGRTGEETRVVSRKSEGITGGKKRIHLSQAEEIEGVEDQREQQQVQQTTEIPIEKTTVTNEDSCPILSKQLLLPKKRKLSVVDQNKNEFYDNSELSNSSEDLVKENGGGGGTILRTCLEEKPENDTPETEEESTLLNASVSIKKEAVESVENVLEPEVDLCVKEEQEFESTSDESLHNGDILLQRLQAYQDGKCDGINSDQSGTEDPLLARVPKPEVSIFSKKISQCGGDGGIGITAAGEGENLTLTPNVEIFLRNANNSSENLINKLTKINLFKSKQLKKQLKRQSQLSIAKSQSDSIGAGTSGGKCADKESGVSGVGKNGLGNCDGKTFHLSNLPCPHCRQIYNNLSALKYHVRLMHSDLENKLFCHLCPMNFIEREYFKIHLWEAHNARF